jgi:hypothetical protein
MATELGLPIEPVEAGRFVVQFGGRFSSDMASHALKQPEQKKKRFRWLCSAMADTRD